MNREQKRKEARKNKKIGDDFIEEKTAKSEVNRLIKIAVVVIFIFIVLYFGVGIFITKEIKLPRGGNGGDSEVKTSADNILANSTLNQKEIDYYVYFYDFKNEDKEIASLVASNLSSEKVYFVDTSDILNKNYVVEENSNKQAQTQDELKVKKDTIIRINNKKITEYYEGLEEIKENMK